MTNQELSTESPLINVRQLIRDKNAKIAKFIPSFVYSLVERTVHQHEINEFITSHNHLRDIAWMRAALQMLGVSISVVGHENLPETPHNVFIGNHPLGMADGMGYFSILGDKYPEIRAISNQLLGAFPNIRGLYTPLNMLGSRTRSMLKSIDDLYASPHEVLHFPAGRVSRKEKGIVSDMEWAKSFVAKSVQHKRTIVPAFISGQNSERFYRVANLRKALGIEQAYELFLLVDEAFRQRGNTITFTFGKPVDFAMLDRSRRPEEWSVLLRHYVYGLEKEPSLTFEDVLARNPK